MRNLVSAKIYSYNTMIINCSVKNTGATKTPKILKVRFCHILSDKALSFDGSNSQSWRCSPCSRTRLGWWAQLRALPGEICNERPRVSSSELYKTSFISQPSWWIFSSLRSGYDMTQVAVVFSFKLHEESQSDAKCSSQYKYLDLTNAISQLGKAW